jgi:putative transposase
LASQAPKKGGRQSDWAALRGLIRQKCSEKGWTLLELAVQPDHIHVFVRVWPSVSAAEVVKECKGYSACTLRKEFPDLHRLPSLWTRS